MPEEAVEIAQEVWRKLGAGDWDGARAMLADDYVQEWPQSRERIEGPDDALAINRNFPGGMPTMTFRRATGSGEVVVLEVDLRYPDGSRYQGVSVIQVRDGKVVKEVDYFAQPFDPPQWRAQWVKRMPA
jgi:ketosteroid isomerase-like protein